nr:short chain dehydrogenase andi [Quercus suber]
MLRHLLTLPSALLLLLSTGSPSVVAGLQPRDENTTTTTIPAPISVAPDDSWDGIDGSWSTFTLRVGTPEQLVHTLVSFASYQTWVVLPQGCESAPNTTACALSRGGTFVSNDSSTWDYVGLYYLGLEQELGYTGNAFYGYDTVGLGGAGAEGPTVLNTTVGAFADPAFYLGVFGIDPKPTNFSGFSDESPSYMSKLKDQNQIATLSAGFTAGARYRYATGAPASLTLGGYDSSRFTENDVEFTFGADNSRELVVVIQDITTPSQITTNPTATKLLPSPVYALIDSTVPQIWLPLEACLAFEAEFGLVYDNTTDLYLVNDTLHQDLQQRNPNVTFQLAMSADGGNSVQIELPYAAFDLSAQAPYAGLTNTSNYFPLRRAQNSSQYTLGRTFLQEAYLSVDWETQRFNVSQAVFNQSAQEQLVALPSLTGASVSGTASATPASSGLSGGDIAGIVIGVLAAVVLLAILAVWLLRRRSKAAKQHPLNEKLGHGGSGARGMHPTVFPKAELEGSMPEPYQLHGAGGDFADTRLLSGRSTNANSPHSARPSTAGHPTFGPGSTSGDVSSNSPTTSSHGESGTYSSIQSGHPISPASITGRSLGGPASIAGFSYAGSDAPERPVYEMLGDMPTIKEKDGRPLSEKEALQHRERIYNGVGAALTTPSPTSPDAPPDHPPQQQRPPPGRKVRHVYSRAGGHFFPAADDDDDDDDDVPMEPRQEGGFHRRTKKPRGRQHETRWGWVKPEPSIMEERLLDGAMQKSELFCPSKEHRVGPGGEGGKAGHLHVAQRHGLMTSGVQWLLRGQEISGSECGGMGHMLSVYIDVGGMDFLVHTKSESAGSLIQRPGDNKTNYDPIRSLGQTFTSDPSPTLLRPSPSPTMTTDWGTQGLNSFVPTLHSAPYAAIDPSTAALPSPFTVCIVGASRGIGAGLATAYAHAGASGLILASRRRSGLEATARACRAINAGLQIEIVECDITSAESVEALAARVAAAFPARGLDVVAVNSGFSGPVVLDVVATDPATFAQASHVNYLGTFLCAKFLIPLLLAPGPRPAGRAPEAAAGEPRCTAFVAVSSLAALVVRGPIANAQYCVSKLAQLKLLEHLHEQYGATGSGRVSSSSEAEGEHGKPLLNVFAVHPGAVASEMALETAPREFLEHLTESPELCGAFCVWLTKGKGKRWLSGRLVSALWDVEELEGRRAEVEKRDLLKVGMRM